MKRFARLLKRAAGRLAGGPGPRHPRGICWLAWGVTWVAAAVTMAVMFGLWDVFTSRDLSRFPHHESPVMSALWVLMVASSVATFVATRVCRRLGLSLEAESAAAMRRAAHASAPHEASVVVFRSSAPTVWESLLILTFSIGILLVSRVPWLNPPDALPVWPLGLVLGVFGAVSAVVALFCRRGGDQGIVLADKYGVRLSSLPHADVIPWEQIGGCTVETKQGVLGDTTRMRIHLQGHQGRLLGVVDLDRVPAPQQAALLALVRLHHGLPAREPTELESSPPPEGTGSELEAALAPAGRGTELEASPAASETSGSRTRGR